MSKKHKIINLWYLFKYIKNSFYIAVNKIKKTQHQSGLWNVNQKTAAFNSVLGKWVLIIQYEKAEIGVYQMYVPVIS